MIEREDREGETAIKREVKLKKKLLENPSFLLKFIKLLIIQHFFDSHIFTKQFGFSHLTKCSTTKNHRRLHFFQLGNVLK